MVECCCLSSLHSTEILRRIPISLHNSCLHRFRSLVVLWSLWTGSNQKQGTWPYSSIIYLSQPACYVISTFSEFTHTCTDECQYCAQRKMEDVAQLEIINPAILRLLNDLWRMRSWELLNSVLSSFAPFTVFLNTSGLLHSSRSWGICDDVWKHILQGVAMWPIWLQCGNSCMIFPRTPIVRKHVTRKRM